MASHPKTTSRWGSFLQQAVAGVESRLDTILADDESSTSSRSHPARTTGVEKAQNEDHSAPRSSAVLDDSKSDHSRLFPTNQRTDRLQERLAKALVNQNASSRSPTPQEGGLHSVGSPVADGSPMLGPDKPKEGSLGVGEMLESLAEKQKEHVSQISNSLPNIAARSQGMSNITNESQPISAFPGNTNPGVESASIASSEASKHLEAEALKLRQDYEALVLLRKKENDEFKEMIDSLQTKLQFLAQEAADSANSRAKRSASGSVEEKLAKKDEKIALLLGEGQKLSQSELRLSSSLKKIRAKSAEEEKRLSNLQSLVDRFESSKLDTQREVQRLKNALEEEKLKSKSLGEELQLNKAEFTNTKSENESLRKRAFEEETLHDGYRDRIELERERDVISNLQDDLSSLKLEKKLSEDRCQTQVQELLSQLSREKERGKAADLELKNEVKSLESRLENYRTRAEEFSTTNGGENQAKLFRQIEILQSQYTVASDNWRGIEGSLIARINGLEKDRDDLSKKEGELRKKFRESVNKCRRLEEELQAKDIKISDQLSQLDSRSQNVNDLQDTLDKVELELKTVRDNLNAVQEKRPQIHLNIQSENLSSEETAPGLQSTLSQGLSGTKSQTASTDKFASFTRRQTGSLNLMLNGTSNLLERSSSRKALANSGSATISSMRYDSQTSATQSINRESLPSQSRAPSTKADQEDDILDGIATPATPEKTVNDMFSASTAAAGPSVQLVERMSATVRRLESEKAASKDEMERLTAQRDEAREEVISLINEVEAKRNADSKVSLLETEVFTLNERYQTTLEMLGEKSEQVEELKADIADMKQIYKDVLEKTVQ